MRLASLGVLAALLFSSDNPRKLSSRQITGLQMGTTIKGIDFPPRRGRPVCARQ